MEGLRMGLVIFGGVLVAWLLLELRDRGTETSRPNTAGYAMLLLIPSGLLVGLAIKSATGHFWVLAAVLIGAGLAVMAELSRIF